MNLETQPRNRSLSVVKPLKSLKEDINVKVKMNASYSSMNISHKSSKIPILNSQMLHTHKNSNPIFNTFNGVPEKTSNISTRSTPKIEHFSNSVYKIAVKQENKQEILAKKQKLNFDPEINEKINEINTSNLQNDSRFNIYRDIFTMVIQKDKQFGFLLSKVKDAYDSMVQQSETEAVKQLKDQIVKLKFTSIDQNLIEDQIKDVEIEKYDLEKELRHKNLEITELLNKCQQIPALLQENHGLRNQIFQLEKFIEKVCKKFNIKYEPSEDILLNQTRNPEKRLSKKQFTRGRRVTNKIQTIGSHVKLPSIDSNKCVN